MILLTSTSDLLQVITSAAGDIDVHASYMDFVTGATTATPGRQNTASIVTATTTDVVGSPGANTSRNVKLLTVRNTHISISNIITIRHTDGVAAKILWKGALDASEQLVITSEGYFQVYDLDGIIKMNQILTEITTTNSDQRAADYGGLAPDWNPTGTLGIAKDTITKRIWFNDGSGWE